MGSDGAPSEDNLEIEVIEKVLPVQEDPDLAQKFSNAVKTNDNKSQEPLKNESPLKRLNTIGAGKDPKKKTRALGTNPNQSSLKKILRKPTINDKMELKL